MQLSGGYFLRNKKRTIKGVKLLSIGLVIVISSILIIYATVNQFYHLSMLLGQDDRTLVVEPTNGLNSYFDDPILQELYSKLNTDSRVESYSDERLEFGSLHVDEVNITLPFHLINMTNYFNSFVNLSVQFAGIDISEKMIITSDIVNSLNLNQGAYYQFQVMEVAFTRSLFYILNIDIDGVNSGIYINQNEENFETLKNMIFIKLTEKADVFEFLTDYSEFKGIKIRPLRAEQRFLDNSARQIINTLYLLLYAISILVVLSISNLMLILIYESQNDIQILRSIGYSPHQISFLFVMIGLIIGVVGSAISLLISYAVVSLTISLISIILHLPFIVVEMPIHLILNTFINGFIVTLISSLIAVVRGIYIK
ncbi:MAG: FtsX-like permease family protein [Candidatus Heimdallarchaeota archaeon]|nr:FtsX-like permease family protein [Candidatus Heimdallarchaeota archaeon]